jgi:hypothetical protein
LRGWVLLSRRLIRSRMRANAKVIGGVGQESNSVLELSRVQTRRRLHGLKNARCLVYETGQGSGGVVRRP